MKRKKLIAAGIIGTVLSGILATGAYAAGTSLVVNGDPYHGSLYVTEGRIYVPLRSLCEGLGYTVEWDSAARSAIVSSDSARAVFPCGSGSMIYGSSLYTHVRTLAAALGADVDWNGRTATAMLDFSAVGVPELAPPYGSGDLTASDENVTLSYTQDELFWLARIIFAEARGESMEGKIAVANTILERVKSDEFPNTIYGVIFDDQYCVQYEPVSNGTIYNTPDEDSYEAARRALEGEKAVENCLYFFNPAKASSNWIAQNRTYVTTIGNHVFYA
ncbi:MAG: cell wall hydrolase [Clostridiaceae bacterium]|nr:cell wall hydrolase [Clostridiaceae bacterium]